MDTSDEPGLYVGTTSGEIFYSLDEGDSWAPLQAHLPGVLSLEVYVV